MSGIKQIRKAGLKYISRLRRGWHVHRWFQLGATFLIALSVCIPVLQEIAINRSYALDPSTLRLVGAANENLVTKFSYDSQSNSWQFNKDGITAATASAGSASSKAQVLAGLQAQVGGNGKKDNTLYSVDLPADPTKGMTYYDNNTNLSFSMIPQFKVKAGREQQGRLVYPFEDGGKLVYTAKNNGMKEDIVLSHNIGDQLQFSYKLKLPNTLEAKQMDDGSIGIYSADPALFGNIQFGDANDEQKVENARVNGEKDHLLFALPAPVIKDSKSGSSVAQAGYYLDDNTLTVKASGLSKLTYPTSIDPSVVVTSTSDFTAGNNEGNIDFPANQINRGAVTGGNIGNLVSGSYSSSWTTATNSFGHGPALTGGRMGGGSVAYNGYLYVFGGGDTTNKAYEVQCAAIDSSTGDLLSSWNTSTNTMINSSGTTNTGRQKFGFATYDGYLYIGGGNTTGAVNDVSYAQLTGGSNCVGAFTQTSAFNTTNGSTRQSVAMTAYQGYMYAVGGLVSGSPITDVQYAAINADGTLGTWTESSNMYTTARYGAGAVAYNGYLYVIGGRGSGALSDIQYAKINSNGSLGTFVTAATSITARFNFAYGVYNGYLYVGGGGTSGTASTISVQYAPINANGSIGAWLATTSQFTTSREAPMYAMYNGYMYIMGGEDNTNSPTAWYSDTQFGKVDPPGQVVNFRTDSNNTTTIARSSASALYYHGFLYIFGGFYSSVAQSTVNKATINATTGALTWSTSTALNVATYGYSFAFYNGVAYIIGGFDTSNNAQAIVQYGSFNFSGTINWTTTTSTANGSLPSGIDNHSAAAYGGYLFALGSSGGGTTNNIRAVPINSDGSLGSWTLQTATLSQGRTKESMVAYNGYLYVIGGQDSGPTTSYASIEVSPLTTVSPGSTSTVVGSFTTSTNSLITSRESAYAFALNGYLYVIGGTNVVSSVQTDLQNAEFAKINTNGTLDPFVASPSFGTTEVNFAGAVYNNNIYMVNGSVNGARSRTSVIASINNGGSGAVGVVGSTTSMATQFASGVDYAQTFAANGYLYVMGGYDGSNALAQSYSAPINTDGTVGTWSTTGSLNTARYAFGLAMANGYVYAVGGQTNSGRVNTVEYAAVGSSGTLSWSVSSYTFTTGRSLLGMASYNGYLYIAGGQTSSGPLGDVQYAKTNGTGDIASDAGCGSAWCTASSFTTSRSNLGLVAYNGYLYILGGTDTSATFYTDIQLAAINSNGSLGSWALNGQSLIQPMAGSRYAVYDGYIYASGGNNNVSIWDTTTFAPFLPNGQIGDWQFGGTLAGKRANQGVTIYNGVLYAVGGNSTTGSTFVSDVAYAPIPVQARTGTYSVLVDLGNTYNVSSVSYNGALPGGLSAITVKMAGTNAVFGSAQSASSLSAPAACSGASTRYVWLSVTLDDSYDASLADLIGAVSNVTDITINYGSVHATPSQRLMGGKYFSSGTLQPLDTCGA